MTSAAAKRLRLLASAVSLLVVAGGLAAGWFYFRLRASLPLLDGPVALAGLAAPVAIDRDALGVPTVRGQNRLDVARALGWLHAQDRFFQMDLLRRKAAGELAELFGKKALPLDRAARMHGFRKLAQAVVAQASPAERALLEAYAAGVNAGLGALREKPFEYLVLRDTPQPWRPEDGVLVIYAMWLDLEEPAGRYEQTLLTLRDSLGLDAVAFFAPLVIPSDAALDGSTAPLPPMPGPKLIDLRRQEKPTAALAPVQPTARFPFPPRDPAVALGSNAFALSGAHTTSGVPLVANDMHLDLAMPNTWYRASLEFPGHKITGVTLPGVPFVVAGSNGHVAWGFTDSYADTGDLVVVEIAPGASSLYYTAGHVNFASIEQRKETIRVKGGDAETVEYPWTIWGPVVGTNEKQRPLAYRWIAHDPVTTNLKLGELEDATTVGAAIAIAHRAGLPTENMIVADSAGGIAWTIAGRLPKRVGYDGRLPTIWSFGDRRWDGLVPPDEVPAVVAPPAGRLWSANQRPLGGAALATLGDGGYRRPNRAAQIRDDLAALEHAAPRDLLGVQLDDRALFLVRWQKLLLETLTPDAIAQKKSRAELRTLTEKWEGRASVDSVSYRLVRNFHDAVYARVFPPIFERCTDRDPDFDWSRLPLEEPLWTMLRGKPTHLLNPDFKTWDDLLVAAADDVVAGLGQAGVALPRATWGRRNTARIVHPFSRTLPDFLTSWLNLPADPLPGDNDMPRVQTPTAGASERFVVAPGRENEGIFEMPGGQSGHPLSPYFRAGHDAWVHGEPTPFLPGKTEHTLTLTP
jgi:penicillin amidase